VKPVLTTAPARRPGLLLGSVGIGDREPPVRAQVELPAAVVNGMMMHNTERKQIA